MSDDNRTQHRTHSLCFLSFSFSSAQNSVSETFTLFFFSFDHQQQPLLHSLGGKLKSWTSTSGLPLFIQPITSFLSKLLDFITLVLVLFCPLLLFAMLHPIFSFCFSHGHFRFCVLPLSLSHVFSFFFLICVSSVQLP